MARPVTGIAYLDDARAFRDNAKTAEDLRLALAVLLGVDLFSLQFVPVWIRALA